MPKVSVIVPCYKVEQYLNRCIYSLIHQTLKDIEIILVDDESPDKVPEMCNQWAQKDSRIRVIHKKNEGLGMACNSGLEISNGEYIAFCDSDDWVESCMYEEMYNAAKEHKADLVFSGLQRIDDNGIITPLSKITQLKVKNKKEDIYQVGLDMIANSPKKRIEREIPMSAKVVLYNKKKILEHHLRFESEREMISEDLLWNLDNIAHADTIVELPKTYYYYYTNPNSITNSIRKDWYVMYKILRQELLSRTNKLGFPPDTTLRINRMFIGYVRKKVASLCMSNLSNSEKNKLIENICKDSEFSSVINSYPIKDMPITHQTIAFLMKHNAKSILRIILSKRIW